MKYYPPIFQEEQFHCALCGVYAKQDWSSCTYVLYSSQYQTNMNISKCSHCNEISYWYLNKMIVPPQVQLNSQILICQKIVRQITLKLVRL
jgi:hypothetical protein